MAKCSCFGPLPQFHPNNYSIWPDNHCVNHNYTEPAVALTRKTPAAPSLSRSLHLWRRGRPAGALKPRRACRVSERMSRTFEGCGRRLKST